MVRALKRLVAFTAIVSVAVAMETSERLRLRDQVEGMFLHGYSSYMKHAFPADELMPLSCKGRYRGIEENRGDIDDAMGNFSLTLVDSADTLVIMKHFSEFEKAVKLIIEHVRLDNDVTVSVFETNIRMLGGLLSNHILSRYLKESLGRMTWYKDELLVLAKELGLRLLPSFNSTTGIPHPRINLRWGMKSSSLPKTMETCTACAGTMLLEFAALSRLTGEPIFEAKARKAMDYLWLQRHRSSDLVGTVINVNSGDWIRRDSGVGAGIDSYYEYCLKAYILLGDGIYLDRFNKHYAAVMKYISQGPMLVDVHMHRPNTNSKNFMDALLAFWPGLQVLKGDIKPAIETHEMLYQVMQRHNFLPEAFTTDFQVHWGQHPLRPEFIESTYFLYKATNDPYYLEVGRKVVESLEKYARVPCGFAAVKDVRTNSKDDRMDSFVLAETFKYLYLLFADKSDVPLDIDQFVFTTEAHLLPLILSRKGQLNVTATSRSNVGDTDECPNSEYFRNADKIRLPLKNLVEGTCPSQPVKKRRLLAAQFDVTNTLHVELIRQMGVLVAVLGDGRMQLVHNAAHAYSAQDAQEGLLFMQEMIQLAKNQNRQEQEVRSVQFMVNNKLVVAPAGPAQFGPDLGDISNQVSGEAEWVAPLKACLPLTNCDKLRGKVAIMERGDCMFIEKARNIEKCGAIGGIVLDTARDSSARSASMFAMSGDGGQNDPTIPVVFLFALDAKPLLEALVFNSNLQITLADATPVGPLLSAETDVSGTLLTESQTQSKSSQDRSLESDLQRLLLEIHELQANQYKITNQEREKRLKRLLMYVLSEVRSQKKDLKSALAALGVFKFDEEVDLCDERRSPNPTWGAKSFVDFIMHRRCSTCLVESP